MTERGEQEANHAEPTKLETRRLQSAKPQSRSTEPDERPRELGGPAGPEPTRYGDWERAGRCIDF